jgi:hypothetical protein
MSETGTRDAWLDDLQRRIRTRAEKSQLLRDERPIAPVPAFNWPEVSSRLGQAAAVAVADDKIPVGRHHTGLRRVVILRLRRLIVAALRFLTTRQSEYNLGVLHALRETGKAVRSLENQLAIQNEEIRQLRERLSHLEEHPPVEEIRQAS